MAVDLYPYQVDALKRMKNGCILYGNVGSGKSCVSLAYAYTRILKGSMKLGSEGAWGPPTVKKDIFIITTAKKRDTKEWEDELYRYGLSTDISHSTGEVRVVVDSWNNIKKYSSIAGAFFIFDEDRVTGKGSWVKNFIKITRHNEWIILSGTPGDTYIDYAPVFIANGFYKNRTEFNEKHVIFAPYRNFPVIDRYVGVGELERHRRDILVRMESPFNNKKVKHIVICGYDKALYKTVWKERWDPFENKPIDETGKLLYLLRCVVNEDNDRIEKLKEILEDHPKVIIFYNFTPELLILRKLCNEMKYEIGEWNGEVHSEVPTGEKWVYLVQYIAGAEAWSCITTDTIIFYSLNYSYKTMVQAAGRIDRLNTPFKELHYYYLESKAPIDLGILRALHEKRNFNERAFLDLAKRK